jgi:hypothetical protein
MQAMEWMREFGSATCGACRHKSHKVEMITLEEEPSQESQKPPRLVGPGRPASPIKAPRVLVFSRQAAHSTLCLCARVFSTEPP